MRSMVVGASTVSDRETPPPPRFARSPSARVAEEDLGDGLDDVVSTEIIRRT
jgi:hypothetical protein